MSDTTKNTISLSVVIAVFTLLVGIIFTFFQLLRTADVQASSDRDTQMSKRIDRIENMQSDIIELKEGQARIMARMGIKNDRSTE